MVSVNLKRLFTFLNYDLEYVFTALTMINTKKYGYVDPERKFLCFSGLINDIKFSLANLSNIEVFLDSYDSDANISVSLMLGKGENKKIDSLVELEGFIVNDHFILGNPLVVLSLNKDYSPNGGLLIFDENVINEINEFTNSCVTNDNVFDIIRLSELLTEEKNN